MPAIRSFRDLETYKKARAATRTVFEATQSFPRMETQAWLDHALDCACISPEQFRKMDATWQSIGAMLHSMIERADSFCRTLAS